VLERYEKSCSIKGCTKVEIVSFSPDEVFIFGTFLLFFLSLCFSATRFCSHVLSISHQTTVASAPKLTASKETKAAAEKVETAKEKKDREAAEAKEKFSARAGKVKYTVYVFDCQHDI
jgi:hypothetical protein